MYAVFVTLALLAQAPTPTAPVTTPTSLPATIPVAARRVLVLDLEAVGVAANEADAATRILTSAAAETKGLAVFSSADLRRLAALEAERSAVGCDSETCLAEIAGALGAELVLYGSMSRLGTTTTTALSLYEPASGETKRAFVEVDDVAKLPRSLRARTAELLGAATGSVAPLEPPSVEAGVSPLPIVLLVSGGVLAVGGGAGLYLADGYVAEVDRPGHEKEQWQWIGRGAAAVGIVGVGVAVVGAVLLVGGGE